MSQENINQELRDILNEVGYNVTTEELAELNDNELETIFGGLTHTFDPVVRPVLLYGTFIPPIPDPSYQAILEFWRQQQFPVINAAANNDVIK